jgi:hypothetical protein
VSPPSSSVRGEQKPPPNFPLFRAQHRLPELAEVAAPPPYGAGRRGCPRHLPDPLALLACSPATRRAQGRAKWRPEQQDRVRRRSSRRGAAALPVSGDVAAASRTHASRALGSAMNGPDQIPLHLKGTVHRGPVRRAHGAVHGARVHPWLLDLRSTALRWLFCLRAPDLLDFSKPVLPPLRIFTVRS